jgi:serine/threonine-protein kinase
MLLANRYQVIQKLGEGGFGQTFLARDIQMPSQRTCVIKQLKPTTINPELYHLIQERFQREAIVLEKLGERSRQIPTLYGYLSENQDFFLIQEWIEGSTLNELIHHQNWLSEDAVRAILLNLLPVLELVHSQGIIHRDIKPENIIIRQADQMPVLIDFGAVRETMGTVFNSRGNPTSSIVIGTPGYMPSEQAAGRPIPSSDLYSLGLTAIYALTGKMPQELISDPQSGEILWRHHAPHLSADFAEILDKATRSHPRDRYSSAAQMLAALEGGVPSPAIPSPTVPLSAVPPTVPPTAIPSASIPPTQNVQPTPNSAPDFATVSVSPTQPVPDVHPKPTSTRSPFLLLSLMLGGLVGAAILVGVVLTRTPPSVVEQPTPTPSPNNIPDITSSPTPSPTQVSPSPSPQTNGQIGSNPSPLEPITPEESIPSPESNRPITQPLSEALVLVSTSGNQIDIYAQPSTQSAALHYGLDGDRVTALEQTQGNDGYTWYFVQFSSGADGWVRSDFIRSGDAPPAPPTPAPPPANAVSFPRAAQITGQSPGSRVNVRSAPSTRSNAPHYGLVGDRVTALDQTQGDDGATWYFIQFSSGATGWIRDDFVELQ